MPDNSSKAYAILLFVYFLISGCSATLTKTEIQEMENVRVPEENATPYRDALDALGIMIEKYAEAREIFQVKPVINKAGGTELPFNLTDMVVSTINSLAGRRLLLVPYDPKYAIAEATTGGKRIKRTVHPTITIAGSITEFDKNIDVQGSNSLFDVIFGGGRGETDIGAEIDNWKSKSRITLDFHTIDYKRDIYLPRKQVSNTIYVYEIQKSNEIGFSIYGSGIGSSGKLKIKQGPHRAVRNLVEFSILELFGKFYDLPYWRVSPPYTF